MTPKKYIGRPVRVVYASHALIEELKAPGERKSETMKRLCKGFETHNQVVATNAPADLEVLEFFWNCDIPNIAKAFVESQTWPKNILYAPLFVIEARSTPKGGENVATTQEPEPAATLVVG